MDEFEAIKTQMEARRSSLAEKLEALENQVADSVQGVTSAVSNAKEVVQDTVDSVKDSVESVKDSMQETMGSVKEAFDFERQFDNHPWLLMGGALVLGFAAGQALPDMPATGRSSRSNGRTPSPYGNGSHRAEGLAGTTSTPATAGVMSAASMSAAQQPQQKPSWFHSIAQSLAPEIDKLKALAIGTALGLARDYVKKSVPPDLGNKLSGMFDDMTQKLGGQPVRDDLAGAAASYRYSDSR